MNISIPYTVGAGDTAIYARQRDYSGNFASFLAGTWVASESSLTKAFLAEVSDGYFVATFTPIAGVWPIEVVEVSTGEVIFIGDTDETVASRLPTSGYTAPDNAGIAAIPTNPLLDDDPRIDALPTAEENAETLLSHDMEGYVNGEVGFAIGRLVIPSAPDTPVDPMPANPDPDTQLVFFPDTYVGRTVKAYPTPGQILAPVLVDKQRLTTTTIAGSPGAYLELLRTIEYKVQVEGWGEKTITITADAAQRYFSDYIQDSYELTVLDGGLDGQYDNGDAITIEGV